MIFGDVVEFETFACPLSEKKGKVCWAEAGIPISVKGAIRMEGASEIMNLMGLNMNGILISEQY